MSRVSRSNIIPLSRDGDMSLYCEIKGSNRLVVSFALSLPPLSVVGVFVVTLGVGVLVIVFGVEVGVEVDADTVGVEVDADTVGVVIVGVGS